MAYHTSRTNSPESIVQLHENWTLVILLTVAFLAVSCQPVAPTPPPPRLANLSFEELKERAFSPTYDNLFRNNENHVGKLVYYRAKIIQVVDNGNGLFQLRADITEGTRIWDDPVFLRYSGSRFLDGDLIEFVGTVVGLINYEAVLGNQVTIPDISVIKARLVGKVLVPTKDTPATSSPPTRMPAVSPTSTIPSRSPGPTLTPSPTVEPASTLSAAQIFAQLDQGQITLEEAKALLERRNPTPTSAPTKQESVPTQTLPPKDRELTPIPTSTTKSRTSPKPALTPVSIAQPIILSGRGQQASQKFHLNQGLAIFKITHDGSRGFFIMLLDSQGDYIERIVLDLGGGFDGSKAVGIDESGTYILDIEADGNWTVRIEQ